MKRRILSLLLCGLMIFSSLPTMPLAEMFTINASATGIDLAELEQVCNIIPGKSEWGQYMDTDLLEMWYDTAQDMLSNPDGYTQTQVDNCVSKLKQAFDALKYHTTSIVLDKTTATAKIGQVVNLTATLTPYNAADDVVWTSANPNLATVTQNGQVTVRGYSSSGVKITATSNGHTASCKINILNQLGGVTLSQPTATVYEGGGMTLKATVYGKDTTANTTDEVSYTWSSSNTSVVTVSDTGYIKGVNNGTAKVTVTASANGVSYSDSCTVTVNDLVAITALQPITVTTTSGLVMTVGESVRFNVSVIPANASIKSLTWKSADTSIAKVSGASYSSPTSYATITAVKEGKVKVTYSATDGSGKSGYFVVDVRPRVSSLTATQTVKVISPDAVGEKITVKILPENAGNQTISWTTSNASICQVDYAGVLYPKAYGLCTITGTTTDGSNLKVTCSVRVADKSASVALNKSSVTLVNGKTYALTATVKTISGLSYGEVKWTSSNTTVASVNSKGVITAKYPGTATITATTLDGTGRSAVCVVTVTQPLTSISITEGRAVALGKTGQIYVTYTPTYATNKNVTWTSSDTSVATVSTNGLVYGKKAGTATIYCISNDGGFSDSCFVRVYIPATGIKVSKTSASLWAGEKVSLSATLSPSNATYKTVTWTSSNTKVATVDKNGVVTAVGGGSCVITAASAEGGFTSTCAITVKQKVTGLTISKSSASLYTSQTYSLTAAVVPATASVKTVTWKSSNTSVATVSSSGVVTAKAVGTAVITATSTDGGFTATCSVKVYKKVNVTGITLDTSSTTVYKGKTYTIVATLYPSNASDKGIYWKSSNTSVATVSSAGVVTGVTSGTAVITATARDGSYSKQCKVVVYQPVTSVKLNASSVNLAKGSSKTLTPTIYPADATNKGVTWSSSDTSVVTVTQNGVVTAKGAGSAAIKVKTNNGGYVATCNFTVYVPVTSITLNATSLNMAKGTTRLLRAVVAPDNATTADVNWSSSDNSVATVNASGLVTAKQSGAVKITATSSDGRMSASCIVTVYQQVTQVTLSATSVTLDVGKTKTVGVTIQPSTATYKSVTWTSSDSSVAKVSSTGTITAVKAGTATITATSKDKYSSATCKVTVTQPATGIVLNYAKAAIRVGGYRILKATVLPASATNATVTWKSSDEAIATVDQNGVVTGHSKGTVYITATNSLGKSAKCLISVYKSVTGIALNKTSMTLNVGKYSTITPTIYPTDAAYKTVTWTSSNNDVATVSAEGRVTAIAAGYAKITATTTDGKKTAVCEVLAVQPVTGVKLSQSKVSVEAGKTLALIENVLPASASNKAVTWSSSNTAIAKVSSNGIVTAVKPGSATITVKTSDGGFTAKCVVTVIRKVTGITLDKSSATLYVGKTLTLKGTVSPSDATNKTLYWYSGDKNIATVDQNGVVTPVKAGRVTIGCRTNDGGFKAYCSITVKRAAASISLDKSSHSLKVGEYYRFTAKVLPADTTDKTVSWSSSDTSILAINQAGLIKGMRSGTVTVTAKTHNGLVSKCTVSVIQDVQGVEINKSALTLYVGTSEQLKYTTKPADANNQNVTWSSTDASVASVSSTGVVKALKAGTATIKVKTAQGGYVAQCTVTVKQQASSITLDKSALTVKVGDYHRFTATILPLNTTDKTVKWKSSDTNILAINQAGLVKGMKKGTATVTATTSNGIVAKCSVTVIQGVTGVELNKTQATVYTSETLSLECNVLPADANDKDVIWTSSAPSVATVSANGVVKGVKAGKTTITVITADGGYEAKCEVEVKQHVDSVAFDKDELSIKVGQETDLKVSVLPYDATNKDYTFKSSDDSIVSVSQTGHIVALKGGTATVTVTTADSAKTAECKITVIQPVTGVTLSENEKSYFTGYKFTLTATVTPEDATDKSVIWSSSDESVATVSDAGVVTVKKAGEAVITVKTVDGSLTDSCTLTAYQKAQDITISHEQLTVNVGESYTLVATVLPEDSYNKQVTWQIDNSDVARISENGVIEALAPGQAVITVTSKDGEFSKQCALTVVQPVSGISLNKSEITMYKGTSEALVAEVTPSNASDKTVTWISSDTSVATVDSGVIKAVNKGTATITAKTNDGSFIARCVVTVIVAVDSIKTDKSVYTLKENTTQQMNAIVLPENAHNKNVTYTSTDTSVATVDSNGVITGVSKGTTTITVRSEENPSIKATVTVEVIRAVESVSISKTKHTMNTGDTVTLTATVLPETANDRSFRWVTSDSTVATVTSNGVVTALKAGAAEISAVTNDGGLVATCSVTVYQMANEITFSEPQYSVITGETVTLQATVLPADTSFKQLLWSVSDSSVATVDENGVVTGIKAGTVTVTAKANYGGVSKGVTVNVIQQAQKINLTVSDNILWVGETAEVEAEVLPADTTDKTLTWISTDESVITVDNGVVTAIGAGTAQIVAKSACNKASAALEFEVRQQVTGLELTASAAETYVGETVSLTAVTYPERVYDDSLTWVSSDENIAVVDENGVVTGVKAGTVEITCQTSNSEVFKKVTIEIIQQAQQVIITASKNILWVGESLSLNSEVLPEDTTDKSLIWESSDENVIKVENGKITALSVGEAIVSAVSACGRAEDEIRFEVRQQVTGLEISASASKMFVGEKVTVSAVVAPENAYDKTLTWISSDESVATVDDKGIVTALKAGIVEITCQTSNSEIYKSVSIEVIQQAYQLNILTDKNALWIGETLTLETELLPDNTTDKTLTWVSSDEKVVKVVDGTITAVGKGEAVITVISACRKVSDRIRVEVRQQVTGLEIIASATKMFVGETISITTSLTPENAYDKTLTWSSSDESVATVDENGVVTGIKGGVAEITCQTSYSEVFRKITIEVVEYATSVVITAEKNALWLGNTATLTAQVLPESATDKTLTWHSSDESVIKVENGVVTAVGIGTATVSAVCVSNGASGEIVLEVRQPATSVEIIGEKNVVIEGETIALTATVAPENAYDKTVIWSSSDETKATVDENGVVTGVSAGRVTITATCKDTDVKATYSVKVAKRVEGVSFESKTYTAYIGVPLKIKWTVLPAEAADKSVVLRTSDSLVATVDEQGNVTAVSEGKATITISTNDGSFMDYCVITVKRGIASISLNKTQLIMGKNSTSTLVATITPADATDKEIIWSSSDESVATVDNGVVTSSGKSGAVIITATAADNKDAVAQCIIIVKEPVVSISLDRTELEMKTGETVTLNATVLPADATDTSVIWSTTDSSVVTVVNGVVTAVGKGSAYIHVTSVDSGDVARCRIEVDS